MLPVSLAEAQAEWDANRRAWQSGDRPPHEAGTLAAFKEYYGTRPQQSQAHYYRSYNLAEATWYQLWQTVSEGSPTTPPFETLAELTDYLATHGEGVDQFGPRGVPEPWGRERAEAFVRSGWSPSIAVVDGQVLRAKDIPLALGEQFVGDMPGTGATPSG